MNSKCRTILGVVMLIIIIALSAFLIYSDISEAGRTDEQDITVDEAQKNYLSPISVSSTYIGKTETLVETALLLGTEADSTKTISLKNIIKTNISGMKALSESITALRDSVLSEITLVVEADHKESAVTDSLEKFTATYENHELYSQQKANEELENTITSLFGSLFVTNDALITDYLNVRETPNGTVIGRMYSQTGGTVLEVSDGWAYITSGDVTGWVSADYIITGADVLNSGLQISVVVDADYLKLRSDTSTESAIMDTLVSGTVANYEAYTAGWVYVSYNGYYGYLKSEYVHLTVGDNAAVSMSSILEAEAAEEAAAEAAAQAQAEAEAAAAVQAAAEAAAIAQAEAEAQADAAAEAAAALSADEQAIQKIDAIYAQGRSSYSPIYMSADEIYLLASVIMMEAGSEPYEGKLAVASVVLNRLRSGIWGSSLSGVIYAKGQFYGSTTGLLDSFIASGPNDECIQAAYEACAGINNIGGYMYFCSIASAKYETYSSYTVISRQCFYNT